MLAVGLVVDDAIVMLENIYRYVEDGMTPVKAALLGGRSLAVIAMTITLAAVYAPIGFMTGVTGRLFTEFAWTLAGAVIVSGFVALTLSPMMCSKLLRHQATHNVLYRAGERVLRIDLGMSRHAGRCASDPSRWCSCSASGSPARAIFLFSQLKGELAPIEDQGSIYVRFRAPRAQPWSTAPTLSPSNLEQICLGSRGRPRVRRRRNPACQGTSVDAAEAVASASRASRRSPIDRAHDRRMLRIITFPSNPASLHKA